MRSARSWTGGLTLSWETKARALMDWMGSDENRSQDSTNTKPQTLGDFTSQFSHHHMFCVFPQSLIFLQLQLFFLMVLTGDIADVCFGCVTVGGLSAVGESPRAHTGPLASASSSHHASPERYPAL